MPLLQLIRGLSAAQFAGIVLLFFLPFVSVSCSNMFVIEISGQDFATGGQVEIPAMPNAPVAAPAAPGTPPAAAPAQGARNQNIDMKPSALIAWLLAAVGVVASLIAGRHYRIGSAAIGGVGAGMMFWLKSEIDKDFGVQLQQAQGFIQLEYKFAFWACVVLFLTAAATNVFAILRPPDAAKP
jgi:hypothetical protein